MHILYFIFRMVYSQLDCFEGNYVITIFVEGCFGLYFRVREYVKKNMFSITQVHTWNSMSDWCERDLHLSLRLSLGLTIPDTKLNKSNEFMCTYQTWSKCAELILDKLFVTNRVKESFDTISSCKISIAKLSLFIMFCWLDLMLFFAIL
jgi:hypothetical protein